jgi:carbonic anhydrase/acetyltransferase-like protein (isoleucine patch superfamily)
VAGVVGATLGEAVGGDAAVVDDGTAVVGGDVVDGVVVGGSVVVGAAVVGRVVVVGAAVVVVAVTVATLVLEVSSPIAAPMPPRTTIPATTQAMTCFQRARFRNLRQGFMRPPTYSDCRLV